MKLKNAKQQDINKIYSLGKRINELNFSAKYKFHEKAELKEALKDKNSIFIVAEDNKEIIAFLYAKIIFHRAGGWCMLDNLAVEEDHRNKGIADLLLKELYSRLKKQKVHYIQILEEIHHKNTKKFWKHEGYKETKKFIWAEKTI